MAITTQPCPQCGGPVDADVDRLNGMRGKCPSCGTQFELVPLAKYAPQQLTATEGDDAKLVDQAAILIAEGELEAARQSLNQVVTRTPSRYVHVLHHDHGWVHIKFWDTEEFIEYVGWMQARGTPTSVAAIPNAYPRAFYYLGYLAIEAGDYERAIELMDKGLQLQPDDPRLGLEKAEALVRLEHFPEASAIYDRILTSDGFVRATDKARCLRAKGYLLIEAGDLNGAEAALRQSLQIEPESPVALNELDHICQLRSKSSKTPQFGISEQSSARETQAQLLTVLDQIQTQIAKGKRTQS